MGLMFMLFALSGAVIALAGGSYVLRRILAVADARNTVERYPPPEPQVEPYPQVGGYVPAPSEAAGLPLPLCLRVRDLAVQGRREEAVRMVCESVGADEAGARRIVAELGDDRLPEP